MGAGLAALAGVALAVVLAASLVVVGLALMTGRRWGRTRGLIPVGIVLVIALGVTSAFSFLRVPVQAGVASRIDRPTSLTAVAETYAVGAGDLTLDLSQLPRPAIFVPPAPQAPSAGLVSPGGMAVDPEDLEDLRDAEDIADFEIDIEANVGVGELRVIVPTWADVVVDAEIRGGELSLFGVTSRGPSVKRDDFRQTSGQPGSPELNLDLEVGLGRLEVVRAPV
ncbi:MAG: hypothetical protein ACT4OS_10460 [Acidimicrobiales bacterium]